MNVNKLIKNVTIWCGIYALSEIWFQYGKGYTLRVMKKNDATVDETIDIVRENAKTGSLSRRIRFKIIKFAAIPNE